MKEPNETSVWLRIVQRANLMKVGLLTELTDENQQLCRIGQISEPASISLQ